MLNHHSQKYLNSALMILVIMLVGLTACGNRPASLGSQVEPTATPELLPTSAFTPAPTATRPPTATLVSEPTITPTPADTPIPTPPLVRAVEGNVHLRAAPDTQYASLGFLLVDETLEIVGRNEDSSWWLVLTDNGEVWISAEVTEAENVTDAIPIVEPDADAPLQPTPTPTTPAETATPTPTSTPVPCQNITIDLPGAGELFIGNNLNLLIRWHCDGPVPPNHGFEIRLWASGDAPIGAHDAVNDAGIIKFDGESFSHTIPVVNTAGFKGYGREYQIAVALVQISPRYEDTGILSEAVLFRYE